MIMNATEYKEKLKKRLAELLDSPKEPVGGWNECPVSFDAALALVRSEHPRKLVLTCRERDDCFIFEIGDTPDRIIAAQIVPGPRPEAVRVNRITGMIYPPEPLVFNPVFYPEKELEFRRDQVCIDITEIESYEHTDETAWLRERIITCEMLETEEQQKPR